jgi:hypothetical protein
MQGASSFRLMRNTANRRSLRKRVLPVKIKEAPIERLLLAAQNGRSAGTPRSAAVNRHRTRPQVLWEAIQSCLPGCEETVQKLRHTRH